jgi:hypothetical protein
MAGAVWEEARDGQPAGCAADPEFTAAEITALAEVFPPVRPARSLLRASDFPMTEMPAAPDTAIDFWTQVSESLANGVRPGGRQLILAAAARRYPGQDMFRVMAGSSATDDSSAAAPSSPGGSGRARAADRVTRVLVIGASPEGAERIRPDRDARAIEQARVAGRLDVTYCPAAVATDLQRVLDVRPDVLHLACHGAGQYLVFEDHLGQQHRVLAREVAATLGLYREIGGVHLRGLVIASCDGESIAGQFAAVADLVVAHRGSLDDACAVTFTSHLYEGLGRAPDLGAAARLAARHAALTDSSCAGVEAGLIVLPDGR